MKKIDITSLSKQIHEDNRLKGFWEERALVSSNPVTNRMSKSECISLIMSELGEAQEAIRKPGNSEHIPEFTNLEEEIADAVIRLMDFSFGYSLRLEEAIYAKIEFNKTRPYKHGKNS